MMSIENNINNEIIINKSRFICEILKVNKNEDINDVLNEIKNKYKDATHYCYAYILESKVKFSDDNEPSNTAGLPILNVLNQKKLFNVICIVIRYYGGIKLGAGGLVRAYTKAVTSALDKTKLIEIKKGKIIQIIFKYDEIKKIEYILKDIVIIDKIYDDNIIFEFILSDDNFELIINNLTNKIINYKILKEIYV
ncbi:MAG: YigZ family protein [Bacilli bacterium]|nr:YigZ family protein [Bacilli bacterium]